jgi:hypothetical protein
MSANAHICNSQSANNAHLRKRLIYKRRKMTVSAFLAILLKVLSSPALITGLIALLQKILHP